MTDEAAAIVLAATAIGITSGSDEHTPAPWFETEPVGTGLRAPVDTITLYDQEGRMITCRPA